MSKPTSSQRARASEQTIIDAGGRRTTVMLEAYANSALQDLIASGYAKNTKDAINRALKDASDIRHK